MKVAICGPNLIDQSRGSFHVHAAGCKDLEKQMYLDGLWGTDDPWEMEVESRLEVAAEVYVDIIAESDAETAETLLYDFHFAPCCKGLE